VISIAVFGLVILLTRYISVGSITMLLTYFVLTWITHADQWFAIAFTAVLLLLGILRHRTNIQRLREGTENKIGRKKTA